MFNPYAQQIPNEHQPAPQQVQSVLEYSAQQTALTDETRPTVFQSLRVFYQPHFDVGWVKDAVKILAKDYAVAGPDELIVDVLSEEARIFSILREAAPHLHGVFGDTRILRLEAIEGDEGPLLRVVVVLNDNQGDDPEVSLDRFNHEWWIDNCHRGSGILAFDYEITNGDI